MYVSHTARAGTRVPGLGGRRSGRRAGGPPVARQEATDFSIGVAVYPEHPNPDEQLGFFRRKLDAGAEFAITQMMFDADAYGRFLDRCERHGLDVPVLPGTRILRSHAQARRTAAKFGVSVPPALRDRLGSLDDPRATERALELFARLVERLRAYGAPGVHLFVTDTATACRLLTRLATGCK
jgi:methylenetetrahydrofolate reductase (NADH)